MKIVLYYYYYYFTKIVSQFSIQFIYEIIRIKYITVKNEAYILEKLLEYYQNFNFKFVESNTNNDIEISPSLQFVYNIQWNKIPYFMLSNHTPKSLFNISEKVFNEIKEISMNEKQLQYPFTFIERRYYRIILNSHFIDFV